MVTYGCGVVTYGCGVWISKLHPPDLLSLCNPAAGRVDGEPWPQKDLCPDPILVLTRPECAVSAYQHLCVHRVAMMWVTVSCVWCQHHFCVSAVQQQHGRPVCSSPHPPGGTEARLTHAKQLMSVDSLFWAEQNGTILLYHVWLLRYFCVTIRPLKAGFLWLWTNIFATEHDTTKVILSCHSESTAHSSNIDILYWWKLPKISKKSPYYRLAIPSRNCHFCNVLKTLINPYQ